MKQLALWSCFLFGVAALSPDFVLAQDFGVSTGGEKGTYYAFGKDLSRIAQQNNINLNVLSSQGSLENMYKLLKNPDTQLAIVQHDVLFWMEAQSDPTAKSISTKTKLILPLYNEEVHILAREASNIKNFEALSGKKVAIGEPGSGTSITAETMFRITNIKPSEKTELGGEDALSLLKNGELDAMFFVAGAPVKLFSEGVNASDKLNFVNITTNKILNIYQIKSALNHYNWMKDDVRTVAVKAVLVTYDYVKGGHKCTFVEGVARAMWENLEELKRTGHPKWGSVDLTARVKGWDTSECVSSLLNSESSPPDSDYPEWIKKLKKSTN